MRFFTPTSVLYFLTLTLMASAAPAALEPRALTAGQMVDNIKTITSLSAKLQPVAQSIGTSPLQGVRQFRPLIIGFQGIIQTAQTDIQGMQGTRPYNNGDAQLVCNAFREFVQVHQQLLNIVIGKSGLLQSLFLGPVAAVLRSVESIVDTLAFGIINAVPGCQDMAKGDAAALDGTLDKAICAFTPLGTLPIGLTC